MKRSMQLLRADNYLFVESAAEMTINNALEHSLPMFELLQERGGVQWSQVNKTLQLEQQPHRLQCYMQMMNMLVFRLFDHDYERLRVLVLSALHAQLCQYVNTDSQGLRQTPNSLPIANPQQPATDQQGSQLLSHAHTLVELNASPVGTNVTHTNNPLSVFSMGSTDPPRPPFPQQYSDNIVFDHKGGIFHGNGLTLIIPKGAIKRSDVVTLFISESLFGPFVFPSNCQGDVASSYYWIGVSESYHFQKPVQVEFEHYGACDPSHYQLLCCEDDDEPYTMRPVDYDVEIKVRDDISLCAFQTQHFCSYCLYHHCKDPKINRISAFYLKPKDFECLHWFKVEIWFSFAITLCIKRNKELYTKEGMVLHSSYIFEASCDKSSTNYFTLDYDKDITSWHLAHSGSKEIPTKQVNFYNYYTDMAKLKIVEESSLFPPRFVVHVARKSQCTVDLHTSMHVTLHDDNVKNMQPKFISFYLFGLASTNTNTSTDLSKDTSLYFIESHNCEENKPKFKDVELYLKHISSYWRKISIHLGISRYRISTINIDYPLVKDKCNKIIRIWLETTASPCWCHFVEALFICGLHGVAEEAKKHLQKKPSNINVTEGSPDTGEGSLSMKEELQISNVGDHGKATNPLSVMAQDNLDTPATGTDTTAETGNVQFTVSELLADLEAVCPLKDSNVMSHMCDYNGGKLISKDGSIKITVPKGAIRKGDLVLLGTATNLFSSFMLPSKCHANMVSPYYWIRVTGLYHFQIPVQVEFEHYGGCDPSHYQLLCCEDDDESYIMRPVDCELRFKIQGGTFWCAFQAQQFCSYCLHHGCSDPMINKIGVYFLKPKKFQCLDFFTVEIWFSFPSNHCLRRNRKLYSNRNMVLGFGCGYIFEASCEESSGAYFSLGYDDKIDGWDIDHSLSKKILAKRVNFYNYYTNAAELEASEEGSLFPPRFVVNVVKNSKCTTNLNTNITVSLHNNEDEPVDPIKFKLFVPLSLMATQSSTTEPVTNTRDGNSPTSQLPVVGDHCCDNNRPKLTDLLKYKTNIATRWKEVALNLKIPEDKVSIINADYPNLEEKCYHMFETWLEAVSVCWCNLIEALYACDVGLHKVAEEVKVHLKYDNTSVASPDTNHAKYDFTLFLQDIPKDKLMYFTTCLLPKASAMTVIKDIRCSRGNKEESINKVCEEFLKQEDPSWTKIHRALQKAKCDDLADIVEVCFLPT